MSGINNASIVAMLRQWADELEQQIPSICHNGDNNIPDGSYRRRLFHKIDGTQIAEAAITIGAPEIISLDINYPERLGMLSA
jgi:hypothetical protein